MTRGLDNIDISVVVVAYNEEETIERAINSILMQKGEVRFEIIIGDDGSQDKTYKKIKMFEEEYPSIITSFVMERKLDDSNIVASKRVTNIIKKGLSLARGKYFCVLAGDDYYCKDTFLIKMFDVMECRQEKEVCAATCEFEKVWPNGEFERNTNLPIKNDLIKSSLYVGGRYYNHISTFLFKNVFLNEEYKLDGLNFIDDVGLPLIMSNWGDFCFVSDVMLSYTQRDNSITYSIDLNEVMLCQMIMYSELKGSKLFDSWFALNSRIYVPLSYLYRHSQEMIDNKYDKYYAIVSQDQPYFNLLKRGSYTVFEKARIRFEMFRCYLPFVYFAIKKRIKL